MKTVRPGRAKCVHVETELGIVNVYVGLHDESGRRVERVEVIPRRGAGEPEVSWEGSNGRLIENCPEAKEKHNRQRSERGQRVLDDLLDTYESLDPEETLVDALTDLLHLRRLSMDPNVRAVSIADALRTAELHFTEECSR